MKLFKRRQQNRDLDLLAEEKLYEYVAKEMRAGNVREGLMVKASVEAQSSHEQDVKRKYIQLRVEMIKAESRLVEQILEDMEDFDATDQSTDTPQLEHPHENETTPVWAWILLILLSIVFLPILAHYFY